MANKHFFLRSKDKLTQKREKLHVKRAFLGVLFVLFAVLYLYSLKMPLNATKNPIQIDTQLFRSNSIQDIPVRIVVPGVSIDIPIVESPVVNGYWELSETTASHGMGSANPGESGNIVVFAHAKEELFYNLKNIQRGDAVYITTKGKTFRYVVSGVTSVYPWQKEVIASTKTETVTLYTCSGFHDEKRLVVRALPQA